MPRYPIVDKCPNCGINTYADPNRPAIQEPLQPISNVDPEEKKTRPVKGYPYDGPRSTMPCNVPGCPFEKRENQDQGVMDVLDAFSTESNYA